MKKLILLFTIISIVATMCLVPVSAAETETIQVATVEELKSALANASTDFTNPTRIELTADITTTSSIEIYGTESARKYIELSGAYSIKYTGSTEFWCYIAITDSSKNHRRGVVIVENADVTLKDVTIDAGSNKAANCLYVGTGANVTMNGSAVLTGGKLGNSKGTAVGIDGGSFTMNDNASITGCICSSSSGQTALMYLYNNGTFTMNGGSITDNNTGSGGIIYASYFGGTYSVGNVILNKGTISNNTWNGTDKFVISKSDQAAVTDMVVGDVTLDGKLTYKANYKVSALSGLKSVIQGASTSSTTPTNIMLTADIDTTESVEMSGTSSAKKYINLSGNKSDNTNANIKYTGSTQFWCYNGTGKRGVVDIEYATVNITDVTVDAGTTVANCMRVGSDADVTMKGNSSLINGGKLNDSPGNALGVYSGTFTMDENALIKDSSCGDGSKNAATIFLWNGGTFNMNGGEISNNVAGHQGVFYVGYNATYKGNGTINLNGGKITGNTWKTANETAKLVSNGRDNEDTKVTVNINKAIELQGVIIADTVAVAQNAQPKNVTIDASANAVKIGTTDVTGAVRFNAVGEIEPQVGDSLTFESAVTDNTRSIGFIGTAKFETVTDTKTLTITGGGKTFTSEPFKTSGMTGNVMYQTAIKDVPTTYSASDFSVTIQ